MATFQECKDIQEGAVAHFFEGYPEVNGIGICPIGEGQWGFKVNLERNPSQQIPDEFRGIPVKHEVVGRITAS